MRNLFILLCCFIFPVSIWSQEQIWSYTIQDSLAHPKERFVQGLSWVKGEWIESTGLVGHSTVYRMDRTGKVLATANIPAPHFGEGSAVIGEDLFVITWQSGLGFQFDAKTLKQKGTFEFPGEGWGLAVMDNLLWMSNGSNRILKLAPDTKEVVGALDVVSQGKPVSKLNELEAVGKYMIANVWYSDSLAVIDARTGKVAAWIDLTPLSKRVHQQDPQADVLNGIAWDGKLLWVTGKLWPRMYGLKIKNLN